MTLQDTIKQYYDSLQTLYSLSEAKAITRIVIEDVTALTPLEQHLQAAEIVSEAHQEKLQTYLKRLLTFEPMQHVLGYEVFCGLRFKTNSSVLIPRPETEDLVHWIQDTEPSDIRILDIGTGSGCIAISLKNYKLESDVSAVDVSPEALEIAKQNAIDLKLAVHFSILDILKEDIQGTYDVIVSNPPYVGLDEKEMMFPNVLEYEPGLALFAENPLQFYEVISEKAKNHFVPGGRLYFEMNEFYANHIQQMLFGKGYHTVEIKKDFADKDRMIRAVFH